MDSLEIKYRVVWGIGCFQDFTSVLDALLFQRELDVPQSYPQPHVTKWINGKPDHSQKITVESIFKEIAEMLAQVK